MSFNRWLESAIDAKEHSRQMRKGLGRLIHREIVGCWTHWSESSLRQAEMLRRMRKLLRRWVNKATLR